MGCVSERRPTHHSDVHVTQAGFSKETNEEAKCSDREDVVQHGLVDEVQSLVVRNRHPTMVRGFRKLVRP